MFAFHRSVTVVVRCFPFTASHDKIHSGIKKLKYNLNQVLITSNIRENIEII